MKPRILLLCLLILSLAAAALPAAAGTSVTVSVTTDDPKTMAGLLLGGIMAAFFTAQNAQASPQPNSPAVAPAPPAPADPWADLPAWYVASLADVPVERVIALRRAGHRWVEIAERYRLPEEFRGRTVIITENPAGKVKVKVKKGRPVFIAYTDAEFERFVCLRFLEEYYAVPRSTVIVWLDRGLSLADVFLAVNLAVRVRVQPELIIKYRLAGEPWDIIARRYRVTVVELGRPVVMPVKVRRHVRFERWGKD